jgi:hypothetical protein
LQPSALWPRMEHQSSGNPPRTAQPVDSCQRRLKQEYYGQAQAFIAEAAGVAMMTKTNPGPMNDTDQEPSARSCELSVRAMNVLKELAVEITGASAPPRNWDPPHAFLRRITAQHLLNARNCGPKTAYEIVNWAARRGVRVQPLAARKSLAVLWRELCTRISTGEFPVNEIADALDKSVRRKNTRVPLELQRAIVRRLRSRIE